MTDHKIHRKKKPTSKQEGVQLWSYGRWLSWKKLEHSCWVSCRGTANTLQKAWHSSGKQRYTAVFKKNHSKEEQNLLQSVSLPYFTVTSTSKLVNYWSWMC